MSITPVSRDELITIYKESGQKHKNYTNCLCSAGKAKCEDAGWNPEHSVWEIIIKKTGYNRARTVWDTIGELRRQGDLINLGNRVDCLNPKLLAPTPAVTPPTVKPTVLPKVEIKKLELPHGLGAHWDVTFEEHIDKETQNMWDVTAKKGIETQTILCMEGDTVSVLKDSNNNPVFIEGEEGQVQAFARELKCPPKAVKVGTLHTHPPQAQEKLAEDIPALEVELTHEQSITDLNLLLSSEEIMTCTRSAQSITCFVNTTDINPRTLFKDIMKKAKTGKRGLFGVVIDKEKFKGALITRGIQKFKKPFVGITSSDSVVCLDTVNGNENTVCWGYHDLPPILETPEIIDFLEKDMAVNRTQGKVVLSTKEQTSGLHISDVETLMSKFIKKDGKRKRVITIKPHTTNSIFCSEGYDGKIWCDALRGLDEIRIHKNLLTPRFERLIWDAMYEKLDQDFTTSAMWALMENYIRLLSISSKEKDVKKRNRLKGVMKDYETRRDNNHFIRQMLPLIRLE